MKYLVLFLAATLATASAQLPSAGSNPLANISMDCRETGVGQKIKNNNSGIFGMLGAGEAREHHKTISIDIRNLGGTPAEITPVVYFLTRDASGGQAMQLAASRTDHFVIQPGNPRHWDVNMPSSTEHIDNTLILGTGAHSGSRPAGWIAGCLTGAAFYPIQASSPTMMDYASSDAFKSTRAEFEKKMPADLEKRKEAETQGAQ